MDCENQEALNEWNKQFPPIIAGVAAHDDTKFSARVNIHVIPRFKSKIIVIFGVNHKAQGIRDKVVFESFDQWKSPFGNIPVAVELRENIRKKLDPETFVVMNEVHQKEHSIEAFLAYLKLFNKDFQLLPIIFPTQTSFAKLQESAAALEIALSEEIKLKN